MQDKFMDSSIRKSLESSRFIKDFAHKEQIDLSGRVGRPLEEILEQAEHLADKLRTENQEWLERKFLKQGLKNYLGSLESVAIEDAYQEGLKRYIVQYYRLYRRESPDSLEQFRDESFLSDLIQAYTYDFILLLRISKNNEAAPLKALEIAKEAYHHNPSVLRNLRHDYPEFSINTISYAAAHYPTKPGEFLSNLRTVLPKLRQLFHDMPDSIIVHQAMHHPDEPKAIKALNDTKDRVKGMEIEYPGLSKKLLLFILMTYSKAYRAFLARIAKEAPAIMNKFPGSDLNRIGWAFYRHPENPEHDFKEQKSE